MWYVFVFFVVVAALFISSFSGGGGEGKGCHVDWLTDRRQTRQKLKEAYTVEFLATIERAEKQAILARHGLRLLQLLDDTPVVPGDVRPPYAHASQARQILNDAEDDLREWRLDAGFMGDDAKGVVVDDDSLVAALPKVDKGKQKEVDPGSIPDIDGDGLSTRMWGTRPSGWALAFLLFGIVFNIIPSLPCPCSYLRACELLLINTLEIRYIRP
jgi:hypothetical protein